MCLCSVVLLSGARMDVHVPVWTDMMSVHRWGVLHGDVCVCMCVCMCVCVCARMHQCGEVSWSLGVGPAPLGVGQE